MKKFTLSIFILLLSVSSSYALHAEIYKKDLENRFPAYTWEESTSGSLSTFNAKDGGTTIASATRMEIAKAVFNVREQLVGGLEILACLTETQRDELSGVIEGTIIYNITSEQINIYCDGEWKGI